MEVPKVFESTLGIDHGEIDVQIPIFRLMFLDIVHNLLDRILVVLRMGTRLAVG